MEISNSAHKLKDLIIHAIHDHVLTKDEYEQIIFLATEDGVIDNHERVLLQQLQQMIADKSVTLISK